MDMSFIEWELSYHYRRVWYYGHELLRSNLGSTTKVCLNVNPDDTTNLYKTYIYTLVLKQLNMDGNFVIVGLLGLMVKGRCKGNVNCDR